MDKPPDITHLLNAWQLGDHTVDATLSQAVYGALKTLARSRLGKQPAVRLQATELVNEALVQLLPRETSWQSRTHFFALAASKMRDILVDEARRRGASKRGGSLIRVSFDHALAAPEVDVDVTAIHEALLRLADAEPRSARVLELTYFGGMAAHDIAGVLSTSVATVERDLRFGRRWLAAELTS
jgi:RNA polymerase sigma factor (TIGR02999 family)